MPDFDLDAALSEGPRPPISPCCGVSLTLSEIDTRDVGDKVLWARSECSHCAEEHRVRYRFVGYTSNEPTPAARLAQLPAGHFPYFDCPMCGEGTPESLGMAYEGGRNLGYGYELPDKWHNVMWCPPCGHYEEHFEAEGRIE